MIKHPSVQGTVGKEARFFVSEEKVVEEKKLDTFTRIFGQKIFTKNRCQLQLKSLFAILYALQKSMIYMVLYSEFCLNWGATSFMAGNLILSIITTPLLMINVFIGKYCSKSYIRVWEMVPLFKGIGFSAMIFQVVMEFINISFGGIALMYIPHYFKSDVQWRNCSFPEASPKCVPMYTELEFNVTCCRARQTANCTKTYLHFSTIEFFRRSLLKHRHHMLISESIQFMNWPLVTGVCIIWLFIYIFMINGYQRFKQPLAILVCGLNVLSTVPLMIVALTLSHSFNFHSKKESGFDDATALEFWVGLIKIAFISEIPSTYILLGSYSASDITPDIIALLVHGIRFFVTTVNVNFLSIAVTMLQYHYKARDVNCFRLTAFDFLFAVMPDILARVPFYQFCSFLWFFGIAMWCICTAIFTMTGIVETLTDAYPKLMPYRLCCCSVLCMGGSFFNSLLLNYAFLPLTFIWLETIVNVVVLTLILFYLVALFIYSYRTLMTDYHFLYGVPLKMYWIYAFQTCCILAMIFFVLNLVHPLYTDKVPYDHVLYLLEFVFAALILSPIPIYMIYLLAKNQTMDRKIPLTTPHPNWGPVGAVSKQARKRFNPQREMRYKMEMKRCKHNCLLDSLRIKDEIEKLNERRQKLLDSIRESSLEALPNE